jgi:4'-phosphopantetheinyl transferase EntD
VGDPPSLAEALFGRLAPELRCAEEPLDEAASFAHAEEAAAVVRAIARRQCEFATGRRLAHRLLAELGLDRGALLPEPSRAPAWPEGARGSISHGAGRCLVAVAPAALVRDLGVDLEEDAALPRRLWSLVLRPEEQAALESQGEAGGRLAQAVFSAKEATYKALARELGRVLEFREVRIRLDPSAGSFQAELLAPEALRLAPAPLAGRCLWGEGRVITALVREA